MEILQWLFMIGVAIAIIFLVFSLYALIVAIMNGRQIKVIKKDSRQRKKKKKVFQLENQRKKKLIHFVVFFLVSLAVGGASGYISYYQATNLSKEDTVNITDGFYFLRDLESELKAAQKGKVDKDKATQTINYVVTSLAGYSVKKANTLNTVEGQSVLNRYYQSLAELGINISRKSATLLNDPKELKEVLQDIEKVKDRQGKVLLFYKVDKDNLESEK